tara:strand:+ start:7110 stop:7799 length:690 start_codon:yes stop_codon:yes gene_type:complete
MTLVYDVAKVIRTSVESLSDVEILENDHAVVKKDDELYITNEMWQCPKLRKMHLEIAKTKHLEILHCVFFPDPRYSLPIFGCDVIDTGKVVTAAIVDVSPVTGVNKKFYEKIKVISDTYNDFEYRKLPAWSDIFSPYVKFMRLTEDNERVNYYQLIMEYLIIYCDAVRDADPGSPLVTYQRHQDQCYYSDQQRKNEKTMAVLSKWYDKEWATNYIENILFCKPKGSIAL